MRTVLFSLVALLIIAGSSPAAMDHGMMHHDNDKAAQHMEHGNPGNSDNAPMDHDTMHHGESDNATMKHDQGEMDGKQMEQMNEHLERMDFLVDEIREEKDPAKRRGLIGDHAAELQNAMASMKRMMWCCVPGSHHGGHGSGKHQMDEGAKLHSGEEHVNHQLGTILRRLSVMQKLMGQMVEQQSFVARELASPLAP